MLAGSVRTQADLAENDFRKTLPRFQPENLAANNAQNDLIEQIAAGKQITPAQLALAWVLNQAEFIVPIPGTRKISRLNENIKAAEISLSAEELKQIGAIITPDQVSGKRYTDASLAMTGL